MNAMRDIGARGFNNRFIHAANSRRKRGLRRSRTHFLSRDLRTPPPPFSPTRSAVPSPLLAHQMAKKTRRAEPRDAVFMTASFQRKAEPMRVHLRVDTHISATNPCSQFDVAESCISRARIRNALISHENFLRACSGRAF